MDEESFINRIPGLEQEMLREKIRLDGLHYEYQRMKREYEIQKNELDWGKKINANMADVNKRLCDLEKSQALLLAAIAKDAKFLQENCPNVLQALAEITVNKVFTEEELGGG